MTEDASSAPVTASVPEAGKIKGRPRGRPRRAREETHEPVREPNGRAERIPLGRHRQKLLSSSRPGFMRRWINDKNARILQAQQGGWSFVRKDGSTAATSDPGDGISQIVGNKEGGEPMRAFLMEIRKEWWDADQAEKQNKIDETETQIRRGKDEFGEPGKDGRYVRQGARRIGLK